MFSRIKCWLRFRFRSRGIDWQTEVKRAFNIGCKRTSFWGGISIDPNKVLVSKKQAEESMRILRKDLDDRARESSS